jgi:hypothetical protein
MDKKDLINVIVILCLFFATPHALGARAYENFDEASRARTIADLVVACQHGYRQSNICDIIMELQQLGADMVETIKALMPLGPFEYFLLTVINFASTGRLRAQISPLIHPDIKNTIEYRQPGEFWILLSYQF